mmetsp:Transcript_604/g.1238  ORF Transcript_604/g.1238 Transcript_604/m.1238 type:complete len:290 (+) Transcript_604:53-922(+)
MGQALHAQQEVAPESCQDGAPIVPLVLEEPLRQYLADCFPDTEDGLLQMGFQRWVDAHERSEHHYVEGYFHAVPGQYGKEVPSVHPRCGSELLRQSAPEAVYAFCEAVRRVNASKFDALTKDLLSRSGSSRLGAVFKRKAYLADLAVQVHWGEAVKTSDMFWHMDAANSFLHMAIGVQGHRALHAKRKSGPQVEPEVLWQEPGAVYLAAPCCFSHAVEYAASTWDTRIIAVQCRLLLTESEMFHPGLDTDPEGTAGKAVFRHLHSWARDGLKAPDLETVRSVAAELAAD